MDRLTWEYKDGGMFVDGTEVKTYICDDVQVCTGNAIIKLAKYEDLVEQNRLVELPCKLGDTVYFIKSAFSLTAFPIDAKVVSIRGINSFNEIMYSSITNYNKIDRNFTSEDIGKTVFLSKFEAEQALEELKESNQEN